MKPTRTTQPYRRGARQAGQALTAMLRGRSQGGLNPMDTQRAVQALTKSGRRPKRPARPARPPRPDR